MKLIKEYVESVKCITEAVKDTKEKQYYIEGVFLQSNLKNKNGRTMKSIVTSRSMLKRIVRMVN